MIRPLLAATVALGAAAAPPAAAQDACAVEGDHWDLDAAGVAALYGCMEARMLEGYAREGDATAAAYRGWTATATRPAVAGPHGERFLNTFVNETGAEQYLRFEDGEFEMPVGSMLAKESIAIREGDARVGPLFVMEKVSDAPETRQLVLFGRAAQRQAPEDQPGVLPRLPWRLRGAGFDGLSAGGGPRVGRLSRRTRGREAPDGSGARAGRIWTTRHADAPGGAVAPPGSPSCRRARPPESGSGRAGMRGSPSRVHTSRSLRDGKPPSSSAKPGPDVRCRPPQWAASSMRGVPRFVHGGRSGGERAGVAREPALRTGGKTRLTRGALCPSAAPRVRAGASPREPNGTPPLRGEQPEDDGGRGGDMRVAGRAA